MASAPSPRPTGDAGPRGQEHPLLTAEDLAAYLSLSVRGARQVLERGDLPGFRIGKRWYLRREDLDAAVAARATAGRPEPGAAVRFLRGVRGAKKARRKP